jgi:hypothetical protein
MGYQNESASPNKYSGMKDYCTQQVTKKLEKVLAKSTAREAEMKALKPSFEYRPIVNQETLVPVAAIDGGIAVLFPNEVSETKLLKIAVGIPPQWQGWFSKENLEEFSHVFTGQLRWPQGTGQNFDEVVQDMISTAFNTPVVKEAMNILAISEEEFNKALWDRVNHFSKGQKKLKDFEDNLRELMECSAMVVFTCHQSKNQKLLAHFSKQALKIPYLLIKDGTLYPSKMTLSGRISDAISEWFNHPDNYVIGVIKNSRFVNKDNIWAKVIEEYASEVKSHTFFRLPASVETEIDKDSDNHPFRRYFLSLFGGQAIYEIQIPKVLTQDEEKLKFLLTVITEQVTFSYGGSISTNSYAHERASLPEVEARYLTQNLRDELGTLLKAHKEKKNEQS